MASSGRYPSPEQNGKMSDTAGRALRCSKAVAIHFFPIRASEGEQQQKVWRCCRSYHTLQTLKSGNGIYFLLNLNSSEGK